MIKEIKIKKKKPTEKEIRELREIFIQIWSDPIAMKQAKQLARAV